MKSVNANFLEPSGPLQACNGAALTYLRTVDSSDSYTRSRTDGPMWAPLKTFFLIRDDRIGHRSQQNHISYPCWLSNAF